MTLAPSFGLASGDPARRSRLKPTLRYEIKLVCDPQATGGCILSRARSWIRMHAAGFVAAYPPRQVNSLYFDTRELSVLNDNLMGISGRRKLRLRWYGQELPDIHPILELKQKHNLLGWKAQHPLSHSLNLTCPWAEILNVIRSDVDLTWRFLMQTMEHPTLINYYQREYYATPDDAIRVTLDFDQVAYGQRFTPHPNLTSPLPLESNVVIEIKGDHEYRERIQDITAQFPAPRYRNSKYVRGLLVSML